MSITNSVIFILLSVALLESCISQQKYADLESKQNYYETEAKKVDSLNYAYQQVNDKLRQNEGLLRNTVQELERETATSSSLKASYDDLERRYNDLIRQNNSSLVTSSYEKSDLQKQLSAQQEELDRRARDLAIAEYDVKQRQAQLNTLEGNYSTMTGDLAARNRRILELERMLNSNQNTIQNLRTRVNAAMTGFTTNDLTVEEKSGKLYVSLSQNLLFISGSDNIDWKGKKAIQQLADELNKNPNIEITVEGHTDTDGTTEQNWDLSVKRATAVVKVLTAYGVDPKRITASGRAFYAPIATNTTATGKAQNRRTEIILSPKLDQLYQIIER